MTRWQDKVILITGGSSGIGEATAIKFAENGASLFLVGLEDDLLQSVKDKCVAKGLSPEMIGYLAGDISDANFRSKVVSNVIEKFGRINILANIAGTIFSGTTEETTEEQYDRYVQINQKGTFFFTQLCIPYLKATQGNVVILSSSVAHIPTTEITVYCMIKASLDMFTQCLAKELAPFNVRVNAVNPGFVRRTGLLKNNLGFDDGKLEEWEQNEVKMAALKRCCEASEVADLVVFLSSDEASYITGNTTFIDGGKHLYN